MKKFKIALFTIIVSILSSAGISSQELVHIWENTDVKAKGVTLEVYLPKSQDSSTPAIIVCPGGSYCWLDYETEGTVVAEWLKENGIAAFVLKYRVQGVFNYITHLRRVFGGNQHPDMIMDLQQSIRYLRLNSEKYNINPSKLGVMGFSAGGHLAMSGAAYHRTNFLGCDDAVSLRPDFVAPIYPVVTLTGEYTHKRSRRALLGEKDKNKVEMQDSLSLQKHVPIDCPPVFLVNCVDDPIVKYQNSEMLDSALTAKHISHRYIQYRTGGHGFGASTHKGSEESRKWMDEFIKWLKEICIL